MGPGLLGGVEGAASVQDGRISDGMAFAQKRTGRTAATGSIQVTGGVWVGGHGVPGTVPPRAVDATMWAWLPPD